MEHFNIHSAPLYNSNIRKFKNVITRVYRYDIERVTQKAERNSNNEARYSFF